MNRSHRAAPILCRLGVLALAVLAAPVDPVCAQGKIEVDYAISYARIPIGSATLTAHVSGEEYRVTLRGRAAGVARVLTSGEGEFFAHGRIRAGELLPAEFSSIINSGSEKLTVKMAIVDSNVTELEAFPKAGGGVPVSDADRQGIIDPLTALLVSAGRADGGADQACPPTLPVFDGHRRYDLGLSFKREDKITSEQGYSGPVVVCSLSYRPISGHHPSEPLVNFLSSGRDMEVALAPAAPMHFLAPARLSVSGSLANLVIAARKFESKPAP